MDADGLADALSIDTPWWRARDLLGLKGYVTNIEAELMSAHEVIGSYHDLWHVEQSFRMSKTDLAARPIFHHTREAMEAHLTIVFAALAIARHLQNATGAEHRKDRHHPATDPADHGPHRRPRTPRRRPHQPSRQSDPRRAQHQT